MIHDNFKGIIFMLLHALSTAALFGLVKELTKDISSNHVVFFYKFILLLMILPWVLKNGFSYLATTRLKTYILGSIFGTSATLFLMYGIKYVPLANATALGYMEKILLVIIGIIYFKEKLNRAKLIAIVLSFFGAIIVVSPKLIYNDYIEEFNRYYYFIFVSIILWVAYCLIVKSLGETENVKTQTFYTIFLSTLFSLPIAFINWCPIKFMDMNLVYPQNIISWSSIGLELNHLPMICLISGCYLILSISIFKSFQCGELSVVTPFGYTKIIFAGLIGIFLFKEYPSVTNYIGYILIALSSWYLFRATVKKKALE